MDVFKNRFRVTEGKVGEGKVIGEKGYEESY